MALDPLTMARFLVLPGAEELLDAFSRIPPGPLRESVIQHAQVIAQSYAGAPPEHRMPDPLLMASSSAPAVTHALEGPKPPRPAAKTEDPATRAVQLRLQGELPAAIAKKTGLAMHEIQAAFKKARQAGVKLPKLPQGQRLDTVVFHTSLDTLDARGLGVTEHAASRYGLTAQGYVERRKRLLELRAASTPMDELVKALKPIPEKILWQWITKARQAGHDIPASLDFEEAHIEDVPQPAAPEPSIPVVTPVAEEPLPFPPPFETLAGYSKGTVLVAARQAGMTPEEWQDRQRQIVAMRMAGTPPGQITAALGLESPWPVKKLLQRARAAGLVFPPTIGGEGDEDDADELDAANDAAHGFWIEMHELPARGRHLVEKAAAALGLTLEQYAEKRKAALEMYRRGLYPSQVASALGLTLKQAQGWRERCVVAGLLPRTIGATA